VATYWIVTIFTDFAKNNGKSCPRSEEFQKIKNAFLLKETTIKI
jgi:hypothetical protein